MAEIKRDNTPSILSRVIVGGTLAGVLLFGGREIGVRQTQNDAQANANKRIEQIKAEYASSQSQTAGASCDPKPACEPQNITLREATASGKFTWGGKTIMIEQANDVKWSTDNLICIKGDEIKFAPKKTGEVKGATTTTSNEASKNDRHDSTSTSNQENSKGASNSQSATAHSEANVNGNNNTVTQTSEVNQTINNTCVGENNCNTTVNNPTPEPTSAPEPTPRPSEKPADGKPLDELGV